MEEQKTLDKFVTAEEINKMNLASQTEDSNKEEFIKEHATTLTDDDLTTLPHPKTSCKACYKGRGFTGWDLNGDVILCRCILNRIGKKSEMDNLMTIGELKEITSHKKSASISNHIRPKSLRRALSPIKKKAKKWRKKNEVVSQNLKTLYKKMVEAYTSEPEC